MIEKIENEINNSGKLIEDSKIPTKNIYLKIAPPNAFKRRNTNKINKPKIIQRYEKTPQSNQVSNPYINFNNSNFPKRTSFILSSNTFNTNLDSNNKLSQNSNSSFREKKKIIKGNLFNNQNNIISPKKLASGILKININHKLDNNKIKYPIQFIAKNKSVYVKKEKNSIIKNFDEHLLKINGNKNTKKNNDNQKKYISIKNGNYSVKEKYDYLLEKTRNLLSNYQKIVEYYQKKEKEKENKIEDNS